MPKKSTAQKGAAAGHVPAAGAMRLEGADFLPRRDAEIAHAYLLEAPRERGMEAAGVLARTILCELGGGSLEKFKEGAMADLTRFSEEKVPIATIRSLTENMYRRPLESRYRVFVIDFADRMQAEAQNALLKSLEEPPEYLVWILVAVNRSRLLPTILSRSRLVAVGEGAMRTGKGAGEEAGGMRTAARPSPERKRAAGSNAESASSTEESFPQEEALYKLLSLAFAGKGAVVFDRRDLLKPWTEDRRMLLERMTQILQELMDFLGRGVAPAGTAAHRQAVLALAENVSLPQVVRALVQVEEARGLQEVNVNLTLALEHLFLHLGQ